MLGRLGQLDEVHGKPRHGAEKQADRRVAEGRVVVWPNHGQLARARLGLDERRGDATTNPAHAIRKRATRNRNAEKV